MKCYKNLDKKKATELGFSSNFSFCSDEQFCPSGIDVIPVRLNEEIKEYEISKYNKEKNTINVQIMSPKEYWNHKTNYKVDS